MTSTLTEVRRAIADAVRAAVGDVSVWAAPPSNLTGPGVTLVPDGGTPLSGCLWDTSWRLLLVAPGGDNEAAVEVLEQLTTQVVAGVAAALPGAQITWEPPTLTTSAGIDYLTQNVLVTVPAPVRMEP